MPPLRRKQYFFPPMLTTKNSIKGVGFSVKFTCQLLKIFVISPTLFWKCYFVFPPLEKKDLLSKCTSFAPGRL